MKIVLYSFFSTKKKKKKCCHSALWTKLSTHCVFQASWTKVPHTELSTCSHIQPTSKSRKSREHAFWFWRTLPSPPWWWEWVHMLVCAAWSSCFMLIHSTTVQCNFGWPWNADNRFTYASRHSAVQFKIKLNTFRQLRNFRGPLHWQLNYKIAEKLKACFSLLSSLPYPLPYCHWQKEMNSPPVFFTDLLV